MDFIQDSFECCGITNSTDWFNTTFYEETDHLPSSCCGRDEPETCPEDEAYDKVSYKIIFS